MGVCGSARVRGRAQRPHAVSVIKWRCEPLKITGVGGRVEATCGEHVGVYGYVRAYRAVGVSAPALQQLQEVE